MTTYYDLIDSPVGDLLLVGDGTALTGLYLPDHRRGPVLGADWVHDPSKFTVMREQLAAYFAGERTTFDVPLAPVGTAFQHQVWAALREIPYGETCSYGELAARIGKPGAARAVGLANGRNPISIVVPCHRVIGARGLLAGYAGGVERKRVLLDLEARQRTAAPSAS